MIETLSPLMEQDVADSPRGVTREWIQSLPSELKDEALYRLCKTIEAKPTLVESFALNQVLYRTISEKGETFFESADNVAARTGCDRKTILKGLEQAYNQNILDKNVRPGTSTEYFFKPESEWKPEPERVVRKTDIRTKPSTEFPATHNTDKLVDELQLSSNLEVVRLADDHQTDSNNNIVVVSLKELEEQQQEVSVPVEDTPKYTPWKYVGQGIGRVYVLPELDADTGRQIESIHEATKEPRQIIIKRAVDLLHKQISKTPNFIDDKPKKPLPQRVGAIDAVGTGGIAEEMFIALQQAGIELGLMTAERLWLKYSDKFEDAIAYTIAQGEAGKIKHSKEGFFRRSLEENWNLKVPLKPEVVVVSKENNSDIDEPTAEEMALIDDAIASGRVRDKYYGSLGWLVIENTGHTVPWRQFLTTLLEGHR